MLLKILFRIHFNENFVKYLKNLTIYNVFMYGFQDKVYSQIFLIVIKF